MTARKPKPAPARQQIPPGPSSLDAALQFPIGSVVHLKSGGSAMTVEGHADGQVRVVWSRYDDFADRAFDPRLLVLCTARRPYHDETPF